MKIIKGSVNTFLKLFGYKLQRNNVHTVRGRHFINLALAYEHLLNENKSEHFIPPNEERIRLMANLMLINTSEAYILVNAIAKSKDIPGSVCEFGVAQGTTTALIANEISSGNKLLHLFDSFEGLSKPSEKDYLTWDSLSLGSIEAYEGAVSFSIKRVLNKLKNIDFPFERLVIHKGFIDKVLKEDFNLPKEVSLAFVDFDLYEPIKDALNFLHQITSRGAIIIVHDYDGFMTGPKTAVDEFLTEKNSNELVYELFVLPSSPYLGVLTKVT